MVFSVTIPPEKNLAKFTFPKRVGLELEGFVSDDSGNPVNILEAIQSQIKQFPDGSVTSDAGLNQIELINPKPHADFQNAITELCYLETLLHRHWQVSWTAHLPGHRPDDEVVWSNKPRYGVMHQALARECPETWQKVKQMGAWSALHINIDLDPWSPAGLLVLNVINNVGPYISQQLRSEFPDSYGHMAIWRGWGDSRRLPSHGDFWSSSSSFNQRFTTLRRLVKGEDKENGSWQVDLETPQDPTCASDLGSFWKLARPKRSPSGVYYIELRVLPSVPPKRLKWLSEQVLRGVFALMQWSEDRAGLLCSNLDEVAPALKLAKQASPDFFPAEPLTGDQWEKLFVS